MIRIACDQLEKVNQKKWIGAGVLFAILWSSASTATKTGLADAQPLLIAEVRFMMAGILMLFYSHVIKNYRLPSGMQWKYITIYALLNITVYLGIYVIAMQHVTAGVGALAVATNPLFIAFLSVFFLKKKLSPMIIVAILCGTIGVLIASWNLLQQQSVTIEGLALLFLSMISYSAGAIYFSSVKMDNLQLFTINGWQTLIGGLLLLPFMILMYDSDQNNFTANFWVSVSWLAVPVSVFAVQLWLWLLRTDTVKAGLWLFLCPVFGFAIAGWITHDAINIYTIAGISLVMAGLYISQRFK